MNKDYTYHDSEIIGIFYNKLETHLDLYIDLLNGGKVVVKFFKTSGWSLSQFEQQNVLYNINEFNYKNMPMWIEKDFEVPKEYMDLIQLGQKNLYYIEPSVGLGGYIVAEKMTVNDF